MSLISQEFPAEEIELERIYADFEPDYQFSALNSAKIKEVYGGLKFPVSKKNRPLLVACFVSSIDGTIAFKETPNSGQIARNENFDSNAGQADLWVLNLLRATADGIILGPKTLAVEPNLTGHVFDPDLVKARSELLNKPQVPYNIIVSKTGQSIPYNHRIFNEENVPLIIVTSPQGSQFIAEKLNCAYQIINLNYEQESKNLSEIVVDENKVLILVSGQEYELDETTMFRFLKESGLDQLMIETPSYAHYLIKQHLLDEIFLNQTGIYIGGPKFLNNDFDFVFDPATVPRAKMITIHSYDSYFFCFRYRMEY
mgnify:CR=1 FL=1